MNREYYPTKLWKESSPETQGLAFKIFENMLASIREDFKHINSVLVVKKDAIVCEKYFNGYNKHSLQKTGCIFKSFISAATGVALKNNIIHSLDSKIVDIFPRMVPSSMDPNINKITLKHALTKSTGLGWKGPEHIVLQDDIGIVFELKVTSEPGEEFLYKPDPQILVYAISQHSGEKFINYIDKNLFSPLGIVNYSWDTSFNTIENLQMTTRDIAKLGYLYLHKGKWEDKALISEDYIIESTTGHIHTEFPTKGEYGYLWWIQEFDGVKTYYGSGFGGQCLFVIPEYDMIIVITSKMDKPHSENKIVIRNLINDIKHCNDSYLKETSMKKNTFSNINLTSEEKKLLLKEIVNYFYEERGEEIGIIASESLLDFFMNTMGKSIYNKALDDAKIWFDNKIGNLESDYYGIYK